MEEFETSLPKENTELPEENSGLSGETAELSGEQAGSREESDEKVLAAIEATGLRALVHPLTEDDLADHTSLAHWIGEPVELDVTVLDPPGVNQGIPRFGISDF